jgi:hypothetical protein
LSPAKRGLFHHVCCTNSNWLLMLALTQKNWMPRVGYRPGAASVALKRASRFHT